jgi:hypothetical protein
MRMYPDRRLPETSSESSPIMRIRRRKAALFASALVLLVGVAAFLSRGKTYRAQSEQKGTSSCCGPEHPVTERELDFPYYSLRGGFDSTMNLVSDSPKPIELNIAIRSRTGATVLTTASIQPQQKLAMDLRKTLADLGADTNGPAASQCILKARLCQSQAR